MTKLKLSIIQCLPLWLLSYYLLRMFHMYNFEKLRPEKATNDDYIQMIMETEPLSDKCNLKIE
jgi:hypothetical protein